jgi:hypothetical protein
MANCKQVKIDAANAAKQVIDEYEGKEGAWGPNWLRFDPFGYLRNMQNPVFKFLSGMFADGVGITKKGGTTGQSAEEAASMFRQAKQLLWFREIEAAFDQVDVNGGRFGREKRLRDWLKGVADYVEDDVDEATLDPGTAAAVNATRKFFGDYVNALKESGVVYAQGLEILGKGTYIPSIINYNAFRDAHMKLGHGEMVKLLKDSALRQMQRSPDLAAILMMGSTNGTIDKGVDVAMTAVIDSYVKSVVRRGYTDDLVGVYGFDLNDTPTINRLLINEGVVDQRRLEILASLEVLKPKSQTGPARFRTRITFDRQMAHESGLVVKDLFERDLVNLTTMYGRQVAGHIGMARVLGIKSREEFERWLATAYDVDQGRTDSRAFQRAAKLAEYGYKAITGMPLENDPGSAISVWSRRLRNYTYAVRMVKAGLAQVVELGRVTSQMGLDAMMKQMPAFKDIASLAKDGKLDNDLLRELEAATGLGGQRIMNRYHTGMDDQDIAIGSTSLDRALHKMTNFTSDISGMSFLTQALQRMAMAGASQKMANMAMTGKVQAKELASLGLDETRAQRMLDNIKEHATMKDGDVLSQLNLEKWDPDAANDFVMALYRNTRRVVQENDYGNTLPIMHSTMGKLIFQFRGFMMGAFQKQTLHGVAMHDIENMMGFMTTTFLGALAYIVRVQLTEGDPERREQKLKPHKIAAGALNAAGYSSILPMTTDTALRVSSAGGVGGIFSDARTTELASNLVDGIAAVSTLDSLQRAVGSINAVRDGYQFSQGDAKAFQSLIPYLFLVGVQRQMSAIIADLPKESSVEDQIKPLEALFGEE